MISGASLTAKQYAPPHSDLRGPLCNFYVAGVLCTLLKKVIKCLLDIIGVFSIILLRLRTRLFRVTALKPLVQHLTHFFRCLTLEETFKVGDVVKKLPTTLGAAQCFVAKGRGATTRSNCRLRVHLATRLTILDNQVGSLIYICDVPILGVEYKLKKLLVGKLSKAPDANTLVLFASDKDRGKKPLPCHKVLSHLNAVIRALVKKVTNEIIKRILLSEVLLRAQETTIVPQVIVEPVVLEGIAVSGGNDTNRLLSVLWLLEQVTVAAFVVKCRELSTHFTNVNTHFFLLFG